MRIIGGKLKGIRFNPPKNLPVRPTTDMAKEALFNILQNQIDIDFIKVLDLFSGTGNISLEFASRNAISITSVDKNFGCFNYLKKIAEEQKIDNLNAIKADVFKFLNEETEKFDLIFADPPYDLNRIPEIATIVFEKDLLNENGILIIEHQSMQDLSNHPNFTDKRVYGYSAFSFFKLKP
ncbi:16S rRNA (guanine(966)-N(2))-methyltransferase RsmD [Pedobacter psychrophilus]|uniref:16S rRNA (Guanine(966)-N(2))-methyltransferase RsmD n=1 Tax=Pedobacter psychrophilus TaxID=1826909 RepID=A0A179DBR4_9SPHI|nr:RsmD family RNA methyltransferase [Pedobacter psychrophilus]OAQ38140.1 16S rRNA (guanine(966)-N(2))-methyltransferase RsmD [Pedobacter psychrophilus]